MNIPPTAILIAVVLLLVVVLVVVAVLDIRRHSKKQSMKDAAASMLDTMWSATRNAYGRRQRSRRMMSASAAYENANDDDDYSDEECDAGIHSWAEHLRQPEVPAATLVFFHAPWCPHCRNYMGSRRFERTACLYNRMFVQNKQKPRVHFVVLNTADPVNKKWVDKYGVRGFPSFVLLRHKDGDKIAEFTGDRTSASMMAQFIADHV